MKGLLKGFALAALFASSTSFAAGTLKITIQAATGTTQVLNVQENSGQYEGTLTTNATSTPAFTINGTSSVDIYVGNETSHLQLTPSTEDVVYSGNLTNRNTTITASSSPGSDKIIYDGIVGAFDDFTGKVDKNKLVLFWGKSKLTLEHTSTPGNCSGTIKSGGTTTHTLTCETSGTSFDALFTSPNAVVYWLVNLLVR